MKFFVSYASEDDGWAKWVVWELENTKERHQCVVQFRDFAPGMDFIDRMRQAAESECTLALFSPNYFASDYCQMELNAALASGQYRLLPIRLAKCEPGALVRNRIYIDLAEKALPQARELLLSGVDAYISQTVQGQRHTFLERPAFPGALESIPTVTITKTEIEPSGSLQALFMAPEVGGLSPRTQLRKMQQAVGRIGEPMAIRFRGAFDARVHTLFEELNREAPDIFHFSGKQSGGDILMRRDDGGLTSVPDTALAGMFQSLDKGLKLVVIDTCNSLRAATRIAKVVPCTIGVEGSPYEDDTVEFFCCFYQAIAAGRSLNDAMAKAQAALKFAGVDEDCIPQLRYGAGLNPAKVFLVRKPRRSRREGAAR